MAMNDFYFQVDLSSIWWKSNYQNLYKKLFKYIQNILHTNIYQKSDHTNDIL